MKIEWGPSIWGQRFTRSRAWRLHLNDDSLDLQVDGEVFRTPVDGHAALQLHRGLLWADLTLRTAGARLLKVDGLPNTQVQDIERAIAAAAADLERRKRLRVFDDNHGKIRSWLAHTFGEMKLAQVERRWITHEQQQALLDSRPVLPIGMTFLWELAQDPAAIAGQPEDGARIAQHLRAWQGDWGAAWAGMNEQHVRDELIACKSLFDKVERLPLTEEQARAVICFDNRVLVVAAAGSGKTSTMVAKAAYAIQRGLVAPERIAMLAFNKKAADELTQRASSSFKRLGMDGVGVAGQTFHALGLSIIGKATGRKPHIPDWAAEIPDGLRKLNEILDGLKDRSPDFRARWDLFRMVFGRDLSPVGSDMVVDGWDRDGDAYVYTLRGERVSSEEERMIADWLFYNGVNYVYERCYEFDTATATHRQYFPDFYYPDIGLYHEHFALNANGQPPPHFAGYLDGVAWKRQVHQQRGTALFETTSHQMRSGTLFDRLGKALTDRGVVLDPNPLRPRPKDGRLPVTDAELIGLVRSFIGHAKSNCLSIGTMMASLADMPEDSFTSRHRMFLALTAPILAAWDKALSDEGGIDFEDMLSQAAEHLEKGRCESPYDLVMADEFQDASRARARLCRALVQAPGRFLFAVGDDWQSINRFAGADVSVMTGFLDEFGHGHVLKLEQTFRCPQALCDVSSAFISRNPAQIDKRVRSVTPQIGPVLRAIQADHKDTLPGTVIEFLDELCKGLHEGTIPSPRDRKVTVFILGRYNADQAYMPEDWQSRFGKWIELSFSTIHRAKGAEADYVILPAMISPSHGRSFPNTRTDDPVLSLAMPSGDAFFLGEERRLFYVALTRARRSVAMFTVRGIRSTFLNELVDDGAVTVTNIKGEAITERSCPVCKQGAIVSRTGPYGDFLACSNYPRCEHVVPKKPAGNSKLARPSRVVAPKTVTARAAAASVVPPARPAPSAPPAPKAAQARSPQPQGMASSPRPTLRGILGAVTKGLEDFNRTVTEAHALQKATSELDLAIHAERTMINAALDSAQSAIELQAKLDADPQFATLYEESRARISARLDEKRARDPSPRKAQLPVPPPDFKRAERHSDPEIDAAIERKIGFMKSERDGYLSTVHVKLAQDDKLCLAFTEKLRVLDAAHYWPGIDPRAELTRHTSAM